MNDLNAKNRAALEKARKPYIDKATERGRCCVRRSGARPSARSKSRGDPAAVRDWARSNEHQVSDRGRVSKEVQAAYDAAH